MLCVGVYEGKMMQPTLKSLPLYSTILDNYSPVFSFSFSEKCEKMVSLQLMRTLEEIDYLDFFFRPWFNIETALVIFLDNLCCSQDEGETSILNLLAVVHSVDQLWVVGIRSIVLWLSISFLWSQFQSVLGVRLSVSRPLFMWCHKTQLYPFCSTSAWNHYVMSSIDLELDGISMLIKQT